ncbi:MAG: DUF664 domain-containing protein [Spirochaetes bacterium]|nr:DUF664 domain-containing protein [Spirochaetota bacterium]MBU1078907.1 DUF664 domain-containing protein [Spirochaetota bacterium]
MKEILIMYARYSRRADESVFAMLDALSPEDRNADRKSHYGSLSGLASHIVGGTLYFQSLFRASVPAAAVALASTKGMKLPEDKSLSADAWLELRRTCAAADQASIDLFDSLAEADLSAPVKVDWYAGDPAAVPMSFLAHQMVVHGIHHRGQVSQILDEMGVEHDFSGIDLDFRPA